MPLEHFTKYVTLEKVPNLSVAHDPYLKNENNSNAFLGQFGRFELIQREQFEQCPAYT